MKKIIVHFLEKYGTKVLPDESMEYIELMMDDHICVEFDDVEYYIPRDNSHYSEDDELIFNILDQMFHV
jgi:uncharacterized protein (DUF1499 family)